MPKYIKADLTKSTTASYGDLTKTYLAGRNVAKTFAGKDVVGSSLTTFADVFTATGIAPGHCHVNPSTGRKFELQNVITNSPTVLYFTFDVNTGEWVYIGKIIMTLPLGTHAYRGFSFDDSDTANIKIMVASTVTTALCVGGVYYTWGVSLSDFTIGGTTIYTATSTNQKGVYFAQYSTQLGLAHTGTTAGGVASGVNLTTVANQTKFFMQSGAAATLQIYGWDTSLGNPSVNGTVTNGIASQTTAFAGTSPSAFFSMGASQNGYSTTTNTAAAFEAVILQNGTTNIPSNFTATPINTAQTWYYMRDLQLVGGVWYFNLATTATGAAVTPATTSATFTMMRAGGITNSHSLFKTSNITPSLTGTVLQAHSFGCATPVSVPAAPTLNNTDCLFVSTSSNLYMGKISDLNDASATWASMSGVNLLGTGVDIVAPTATQARYSSYLDRWVYVSNLKFIMKPHQNSFIDKIFGAVSTLYYEGQNYTSVPLGLSAIVSINISGGWLFVVGSTTGQRGVVSCDVYSDEFFGNTYLISKQMWIPQGSRLRFFTTDESAADFTGDISIYVRSADTAGDSVFSSATGGWVKFDPYQDQYPNFIGPYFQVKLVPNIIVDNNSTASPALLHDFVIAYDAPGETDDNWTWANERITQSGVSPQLVSVRQIHAYSSAPTKFVLTGYDDDGAAAIVLDTVNDSSAFALSSNNGSSYVAWSNMSNFMSSYNSSAGTTEIKVTVSTPPVTSNITWSFTHE